MPIKRAVPQLPENDPLVRRHPMLTPGMALLFCALWLLTWRAAVLLEYLPHASIWFPPAGLSLAAFFVAGWRALPPVLVCAVIATFWIDAIYGEATPWSQLLLAGILFGAGHCFSYGLGGLLIRRVFDKATAITIPRTIVAFLVIAAVSSLLASVVGVAALKLGGTLSSDNNDLVWLPWWIGDMGGAIVLAPACAAAMVRLLSIPAPWLDLFRVQSNQRSWREFTLKMLCLTLMQLLAISLAYYSSRPEAAFAAFFLIIPQMWLVYTESPFRAAFSVAWFGTTTALLVSVLNLYEQALVYQFVVTVTAASAYFGMAVPGLMAANQALEKKIATDQLTGLLTRESLSEQVSRLRVQAPTSKSSILMFDIDHFKTVNDRQGHAAGDLALRQVAQAAASVLRKTDLLGRYGGDEFVVFLPGANLERAALTAERMRGAVAAINNDLMDPLSCSFGAVELSGGEDVDHAIARADHALLQAKREGRNQVQVAAIGG